MLAEYQILDNRWKSFSQYVSAVLNTETERARESSEGAESGSRD